VKAVECDCCLLSLLDVNVDVGEDAFLISTSSKKIETQDRGSLDQSESWDPPTTKKYLDGFTFKKQKSLMLTAQQKI
jgi:hypothetical protein